MCRTLLGFAALTLLWFFCGAGSAQPKDAVALPKDQFPGAVKGHHQTVEAAKKAAVDKAIDEVKSLMAKHHLTTFDPDETYVRRFVLSGNGEAGEDLKLDGIADPFKSWIVTFRSDTDWWKDIQRRDHDAQRQRLAQSRQYLGSQIIVGLGLLLLAGVGYVRLDDYTQRRYTTWLRLGGVATVAALGSGWLMFLRTAG